MQGAWVLDASTGRGEVRGRGLMTQLKSGLAPPARAHVPLLLPTPAALAVIHTYFILRLELGMPPPRRAALSLVSSSANHG